MNWLTNLQSHFQGRPEQSIEELFQSFSLPSEVQPGDFEQALSVFKDAYDIEPRQLRGDDPLSWFTEGPESRNPIEWYFARSQLEDRVSDLTYHLKLARRRRRVGTMLRSPENIREYVLACVGIEF